MNKKNITAPPISSLFIRTLISDINNNRTECNDAKTFIAKHSLVEYCFSEELPLHQVDRLNAKREKLLRGSVSPTMLPTAAYCGTVYAVKNNSIVEFYNYFANEQLFNERSGYISEDCKQFYRGICTIHNMNLADIDDFKNKSAFDDMDELISYDLDRTINFLIALLLNGFILYVKK